MVAPRKTRRVVCKVIHVPVNEARLLLDDILLNELEYTDRPSNRLPWSDPTIAQLVANLQDEVRFERRSAKLAQLITNSPVADLEPPSPYQGNNESEWEWRDEPRWTWPE